MTRLRGIAGFAILTVASWAGPASANAVTEWNALAIGCITRPFRPVYSTSRWCRQRCTTPFRPSRNGIGRISPRPRRRVESRRLAAAAAAAYRMLSDDRICPENAVATVQSTLDTAFAPYLAGNDPGLVVGYAAADTLLGQYRGTTTTIPLPFNGGTDAGQWRPTPPGNASMSFVYLATTTPFTMTSPSQFRPGPPPALTSEKYLREYNEVKEVGAVGSRPGRRRVSRAGEHRQGAILGGQFRGAVERGHAAHRARPAAASGRDRAPLALANLAAADAGIAIWDSKVHYNYWRPIRRSSKGTRTATTTVGDPAWTPFIQAATSRPRRRLADAAYRYCRVQRSTVLLATLQLYFDATGCRSSVQGSPPSRLHEPATYRRLRTRRRRWSRRESPRITSFRDVALGGSARAWRVDVRESVAPLSHR